MNFFNKIYKFMYGRYGIDELYKFNFTLYLLILILNIFLKNKYLSLIEILLVIIMIYRSLSKNTLKRRKENKKYLQLKSILIKPFNNIKRNILDKNYVYKKCHKCKRTLKLPVPLERGIKYSSCPKCKHKNKLLILKKQKIEIIKN